MFASASRFLAVSSPSPSRIQTSVSQNTVARLISRAAGESSANTRNYTRLATPLHTPSAMVRGQKRPFSGMTRDGTATPPTQSQAPRARRGRGGGAAGRDKPAPMSTTSAAAAAAAVAPPPPQSSAASPAPPPLSGPVPQDTPRFADLAQQNLLHPTLLATIVDDLKFDHMMPVQAATLPVLLQGHDCLAQARTGTGKTVGFLLPAIQRFLNQPQNKQSLVSLLVLSPTRELAMQIAKEAERLLQRMPQFQVKVAIGGTNKTSEFNAIRHGCDILVATPGRLLDHLTSDNDVLKAKLSHVQTLVLDEADRMLDMGFLPDVKKILSCLPDKKRVPRQSMLFSATIEGQIQGVAHFILNQGYKFISTVPAGENNTHERVPQFLILAPSMVDLAPALVAAVKRESAASTQFKAIVFAPTAAQADFYGHLLARTKGLHPTSVLHSRITQSKRTRITQDFRNAQNAICVATDVIARGMDFPDVSHVFQVGIPMDKASYIHRLGRTARADADGRGILILSKQEDAFLWQLKDVKLQPYPAIDYSMADIASQLSTLDSKDKVYKAWLGYYKTFMKTMKWSPAELVQQANTFALQGLGCPEVPALEKKTIGKMGLKGVPGLVSSPNAPGSSNPRFQGGRPAGGRGKN